MKVVVLADTHIRRSGQRRMPDAVYAELDTADRILHGGDLLIAEVLDELSGFAPVHAVLGNNDHELVGVLPETCVTDLDGVRVAMIHDSGPTPGRAGRMARRFPDAAIVIFGHSHAPADELGVGSQRLFNPGSSTERRAQPRHTFGVLDLRDGEIVTHRIVPV
ncbi:MAG: metallophosphoesterase family protein [Acidimicrobiales bacterium]